MNKINFNDCKFSASSHSFAKSISKTTGESWTKHQRVLISSMTHNLVISNENHAKALIKALQDAIDDDWFLKEDKLNVD